MKRVLRDFCKERGEGFPYDALMAAGGKGRGAAQSGKRRRHAVGTHEERKRKCLACSTGEKKKLISA